MEKSTKYIIWGGLAAIGVALTTLIIVYRKKILGIVMPVEFNPDEIKGGSQFINRTNPITGQKEFHNGIDIGADFGSPVKASFDGIVTGAFWHDQGGNQLFIKYDNGLTFGYAHLNKSVVKKGERVKKGQKIAEIGSTGLSTGAHLHLTVRDKNNEFVNPLKYFKG